MIAFQSPIAQFHNRLSTIITLVCMFLSVLCSSFARRHFSEKMGKVKKILNPRTGRMVNITGEIGRKIAMNKVKKMKKTKTKTTRPKKPKSKEKKVSWLWGQSRYYGTLIPSMETTTHRYARTHNGKIKSLPK